MIIRQLRNVRAYYRQGGWHEVALRLSQRAFLPPPLFLCAEDIIMRLDRFSARSPAKAPDGYECLRADRDAIEKLLDCSSRLDRELLRDVFERFFREGARCFAVQQGDRVAGYLWTFEDNYTLTYDNYRRLNLNIELDDKSVFIGNVLINENHRLKGLLQHLFAFTFGQWSQDTRFYSAVDRTNDRSLKSHLSAGFREHICVQCVSLFGSIRYFRRAVGDRAWCPHSRHWPIIL